MSAAEVILWTRIVLVAALLLALSPLLALTRLRATTPPRFGDPYRRVTPAGTLDAVLFVIISAVAQLVLIPVGLLAFLQLTFSWDSSCDLPSGVLALVATAGALLVGPATIVAGRRVLRGEPTTRTTALAALAFEALLVSGACVAFFRVRPDLVAAIVVALATALLGLGLPGGVIAVAHQPPQHEASIALRVRRLAGSSLLVGLLLALGAAISLWLAGEIGDRLSNAHASSSPYERTLAGWYEQTETPLYVLGGGLALAAIVDVAIALAIRFRAR